MAGGCNVLCSHTLKCAVVPSRSVSKEYANCVNRIRTHMKPGEVTQIAVVHSVAISSK